MTNTGDRPGSTVVQLYVRPPRSRASRPDRELKAFAKVVLAPGESRRVSLPLDARAFSWWSEREGRWVVEGGEFTIQAGPNSRDLPLSRTVTISAPSLVPPLHDESTIREWEANGDAMAALQERTRARFGRPFGLDEELLAVVGDAPLRRFALFPDVDLHVADVDAVLAEFGREPEE